MRGTGYKQPGNWKTLKAQVLTRDRHTCYVCGNDAHTVDHVIAVANGGSHDLDNLSAICHPCHNAKTEHERRQGIQRVKGKPRRRVGPNIEPHPNAPGPR